MIHLNGGCIDLSKTNLKAVLLRNGNMPSVLVGWAVQMKETHDNIKKLFKVHKLRPTSIAYVWQFEGGNSLCGSLIRLSEILSSLCVE